MKCYNCGNALKRGENFCKRCGAPAQGSAMPPAGASSAPAGPFSTPPAPAGAPPSPGGAPPSPGGVYPTKKRRGAWWIAIVALLCVALIAAAVVTGLVLTSSEGDEEGEAEEAALVTGRIETTGDSVEAARQTLPATGGALIVTDPASPLEGLELEVPTGSYPEGREFVISSTAIASTTFGEDFEPALPLIDVDTGGDPGTYSEEVMLLKLPLAETEDEMLSAFFYDEESGQLEGIPAASSDDDGLTLALCHFSNLSNLSKKASGSRSRTRIVVTRSDRRRLRNRIKRGISVKYEPGTDGWQFKNFGVYPAQKGICTGMSLFSMWYWSEEKAKEEQPLYGKFDNDGLNRTPGFDPDDSDGIRLSTATQLDVAWDKLAERIDAAIKSNDSRNFLAIARDLWKTGKPVFLLLGDTPGSRHVVVAYKVKGDRVYIYDPNFPVAETDSDRDTGSAPERSIVFTDNKFDPYEGAGKSYSRILYIGTWSVIPNKAQERWEKYLEGNVADDLFPSYELTVTDGTGAEIDLAGEAKTSSDKFRVKVEATGTTKPNHMFVSVYRGTELIVSDPEEGYFTLESGSNELGFLVEATNSTDFKWVDFRRAYIERTTEEKKGRTPTELRRVYYDTGELYEEYYSYFDEDGKEVYDGVMKIYLKSGALTQDATYVDGVLEGTSTIYYENGKPDRTWTYKNGKFNGTMTRYRRDGTIEYTVEYQDDMVVPGSDKYYP